MSAPGPATPRGPEYHELPAPTVWPLVVALGLTLAGAALVTHAVVGVVGLALTLIGGGGWWFQVLPEEHVEHVPAVPLAARAPPRAPRPARRAPPPPREARPPPPP